MNIVFVSDLHIGSKLTEIDWPDGDVLVIAGDTAGDAPKEREFLQGIAGRYKDVITVDGNHTHWQNFIGKTIEENLETVQDGLPDNVHYLGHHRPSVKIGDIYFVGCNGWYCLETTGDPMLNRLAFRGWSDNRWCGFSDPLIVQPKPWDRAISDAKLIENEIARIVDLDPNAKIICVTHTVPHEEFVLWTNDAGWNQSNNFFVNTHMTSLIGGNVIAWSFGHTHYAADEDLNGVAMICNPRGYRHENPDWVPIVKTFT